MGSIEPGSVRNHRCSEDHDAVSPTRAGVAFPFVRRISSP